MARSPTVGLVLSLAPVFGCAEASTDRASPEAPALEARIAELEARLGRLEAQAAPPPAGLPPVAQEAGSTEVTLVLDEDATVSCAFTNLQGLATAELAYDAAFDDWAQIEDVGWRPAPEHGCHRYLAFRVTPESARDFLATVVITRGSGRGRRFETRRDQQVVEAARLDEKGIAEFTVGRGWFGTAR